MEFDFAVEDDRGAIRSIKDVRRTMKRSLLATAAAISLGCGTEPSGILTLTDADLPQFILTTTVDVRGTVTREPISETPVIVSIVGGSAGVSDTVVGIR